ncbi:hypothetical protein A2982_02855 [candidate division WWE3 bacterium RIFCSPLOWO2_01_FULL_39_13]|uniref:PDZ domain-containing protein n=1 Tax=candidate division WWE3 bacterium RIFCSPLOWO2_01_FULL_39_13 TaxID=1802624 RepID=A0A1F4V2U6_UNCKA|nr:MAG: hypothetical protein A2982_02855 [candidate division WWE3 bacterium RIFCSPLOWO2_01_FULL_39_13]
MNDIKKFVSVILIVGAVYLGYYYQDSIVDFAKNPVDSLLKKNSVSEPSTNAISPEKVKVEVIEEEDAVIKVVRDSLPAVVSVVKKSSYYDPFNGPTQSEDSIGTGFIVDGKSGIVLTNKHVISDQGAYSVVIGENDDVYEVKEIHADTLNDFAILTIDTQGKTLPQLDLGNSDNIQVGQTVVAIGNALGQFGNSVTKGVISGLGRGIYAQTGLYGPVESLPNVIQTDAALNPGNSGGPLLNLKGQVIGINVAISQGAQNIGFSIPINAFKPVLEDFKTTGKISRPFLGVEYTQITKDIAEARTLPIGAFIQSVVGGSPADKAGIKQGDIVLKIDGIRLDDDNTLSKIIASKKAGDSIEIVVDRNGKEQTLKAVLADYEEANQ